MDFTENPPFKPLKWKVIMRSVRPLVPDKILYDLFYWQVMCHSNYFQPSRTVMVTEHEQHSAESTSLKEYDAISEKDVSQQQFKIAIQKIIMKTNSHDVLWKSYVDDR